MKQFVKSSCEFYIRNHTRIKIKYLVIPLEGHLRLSYRIWE